MALGSDIENAAEGGVHTTLFQNSLTSTADSTGIDGAAVGTFPYRTTLADGGWLRDRFGNAWFVPRDRLCVTRERQHSLHEETAKPTEGNFERAWDRPRRRRRARRPLRIPDARPPSDEELAACTTACPTRSAPAIARCTP